MTQQNNLEVQMWEAINDIEEYALRKRLKETFIAIMKQHSQVVDTLYRCNGGY